MPKIRLIWRCELGARKTVRAYYAPGHLVIVARGDLPRADDEADIVEVPSTSKAPEYAVMRCYDAAVSDAAPKVPYLRNEIFRVASRPDEVVVHHAKGDDRVKVLDADKTMASFMRSLPEQGLGHEAEATGYSRDLSFDEAFADAVSHLPPAGKAGATSLVTVFDSGALLGDGFCHLFVKVRRDKT